MCCDTLVARVKERMEAEVDREYGAEGCVGAEGRGTNSRLGILHSDKVQH